MFGLCVLVMDFVIRMLSCVNMPGMWRGHASQCGSDAIAYAAKYGETFRYTGIILLVDIVYKGTVSIKFVPCAVSTCVQSFPSISVHCASLCDFVGLVLCARSGALSTLCVPFAFDVVPLQ